VNVPEQLCAHVMRVHRAHLSAAEIARPWTYLYRQWRDEEGRRAAECVGVSIERDAGGSLRFNVADLPPPP
jgi:hypothetical protein